MERIEAQMVIGRSGANDHVLDLIVIGEHVKGIGSLSANKVGKLRAVIRLNDLWLITKKTRSLSLQNLS